MAGTDIATLKVVVKADGTAKVTGDLNKLQDAAQNAEKATSKTAKGFLSLNSSLGKTAIALAKLAGITTVGAALLGATAKARQFESAMAEVSTLTNSMDMTELTEQIKGLSAQFGADKVTSAKALYQVISAGASNSTDAMKTLTVANQLAVGGVTDVATAADGLTSALNAYGLSADDATGLSDSMFTAMKAGKTTIGELSNNLGKVAPIAAQAGVSFDELMAATAAVTKTGLNTSMTMNSLRQVISNILKPTKEASDAAEILGIDFSAAALKSKGFAEFLKDVVDKTGGSTEAMTTLFGSVESLQSVMFLASEVGGKEFRTILEQLDNKAGATKEAFDKMSQTTEFLAGVLKEQLLNQFISVGDTILQVVNPALLWLTTNFEQVKATVIDLAKILGAAYLGASLSALPRLLSAVRGGLVALATATKAWTMALMANPVFALAKVLMAAGVALYLFRDKTVEVGGQIIKVGTLVKSAWEVTGKVLRGIGESIGIWFTEGYKKLFGDTSKTTEAMKKVWKIFADDGALIAKTMANRLIAIFVFIGKGFGVAVARMVDLWVRFWDYAIKLAESGWDGIKKVFQGDISFSKFKEQIEEGMQEPAETTKEAFQDMWEQATGVDYVGEVADAVSLVTGEIVQLAIETENANSALQEVVVQGRYITKTLGETSDSGNAAADALKKLKDAAKDAEKKLTPFEEALSHTAERIDEAFSDAWAGAFDSFNDFADSLKNAFQRLLAELAHLAITRPIVVQIAGAFGLGDVMGSGGGGGIASGISKAGGLGNWISGGIGGIFSGLGGVYQNIGSGLGSLATAVGPDTFLGRMLGNAGLSSTSTGIGYSYGSTLGNLGQLGLNVGAGFLGNYLGSQLFEQTKYSGIGGGVGGAIGSIWGPIGTAIGSFLGNAVGSLFGKESPAVTRNFVDFGTGTTAKFDGRKNTFDEAGQQLGETLLGLGQLLGSTGKFNFSIHGENGYILGAEPDANRKAYGQDFEAFFADVFDMLVESSDTLKQSLKDILIGFEGTSNQAMSAAKSIVAINELLDFDPMTSAVEDFTKALKDSNRTSLDIYELQAQKLLKFTDNLSGSAKSFEILAQKMAENKQMAYEMATAIQVLTGQLTDMLGRSAQEIRESVMSEGRLMRTRIKERDRLRELLTTLVDPEQISRTAAEIDRLNNLVFQSLPEEERIARAEEFAGIAEETARVVEERMAAAMDRIQKKQDEINAAITKKLDEIAARNDSAATKQESAADKQVIAANTPRRVNVDVTINRDGEVVTG